MHMYVILAVFVLIAVGLLFLLDRVLKAVREGRRRRAVHVRLAAMAARAEEADRQRRETADSGAALTALLPAIKQVKEGPRRVA
jgi:uncharacterized MAPEG superfamily protein